MLAGGAGRRMGGVDKGRQLWRGAAMAESVARELKAVVPELIVSVVSPDPFYGKLASHQVPDDPRFAGHGPLAGVLSGMSKAAELGYEQVLISPCDTPQLSRQLLQALLQEFQARDGRPVIADCDGRVHPLHGVYPVSLAEQLEQQLLSGSRRVYQFALAVGAHLLDCSEFQADFTNCNRLDDLR